MSETVKTVRRGKVLEITLGRPPANAFDDATMREMYETFCMFRDDPELVAALVTGAGERIFSTDWNLKAVASGDEPSMVESPCPSCRRCSISTSRWSLPSTAMPSAAASSWRSAVTS